MLYGVFSAMSDVFFGEGRPVGRVGSLEKPSGRQEEDHTMGKLKGGGYKWGLVGATDVVMNYHEIVMRGSLFRWPWDFATCFFSLLSFGLETVEHG